MKGRAVLHPMGWDAFGLPAENAAIDRGVQPGDWTVQNIIQMRAQLDRLGCAFDWSREVTTCAPDYYRWTQEIFLDLFEAGLAIRRAAAVNWDPVDQTVLANEQVDASGKSWRSGAVVERRMMEQWFFRITDYAKELYDELENVAWPNTVKTLQRNWIGKSQGASVDFEVCTDDGKTLKLPVFTTRAETLYGVTFIAVSPDHQLVTTAGATQQATAPALSSKSSQPTTGIQLKCHAVHPLTGARVPVYAAEYVLSDYGHGAVMGVPAHDERDAAFAAAQQIPVVSVLDENERLQNSEKFTGLSAQEGRNAIVQLVQAKGYGGELTSYRLRDWLVSRQRFWGTPIPMVHCNTCGVVPVPRAQLPIQLPTNIEIKGRGASPLAAAHDWVNTECPCCKRPAKRDTDTMDTFVDSAWYFARFAGPAAKAIVSAEANRWLPVDVYVGGIEHATMHLLYARFITRFMHKRGMLDTPEPFAQLLNQGMVHGRTLASQTGRYLKPDEVIERGQDVLEKSTGLPVRVTYEKMSKSRYNGADPAEMIAEHGADIVRLFMLFAGAPGDDVQWDPRAISGCKRWLNRVWKLVDTHVNQTVTVTVKTPSAVTDAVRAVERVTHGTIASVSDSMDTTFSFNTVVSDLMKLTNALSDASAEVQQTTAYAEGVRSLVVMLAPLAPHAAAEMWTWLEGPNAVVSQAPWPTYSKEKLAEDDLMLVVQIGGSKKSIVRVPASLANDKAALEAAARTVPEIAALLKSKQVTRVVIAPRLVNFVVAK
eukprot:TRINITY_DN12617_c0_g1_i2.p1 TRINITY_DN12617_c0_g1~~TRINITY_DN12617_c0_g1_i2.p1  ORF type:complete len:855 (-),score=214.20 TRINITY_DN12617_c0_g1_i2:10-2307(-)